MNPGCDLINLKAHAKFDTLSERRKRKLYSRQECTLISNAGDPFVTEALMWASKETVYKATRPTFRKFAPKDFEVIRITEKRIEAVHQGNLFLLKYEILSDYLVVWYGNLVREKPIVVRWSGRDYVKVLQDSLEGYVQEGLKIVKESSGAPLLIGNKGMSTKKLSISHHEGLLAIALSAG